MAAAWTVLERRVVIPDLVEEVDLVSAREQRRPDAVDGSVAPALLARRWRVSAGSSYRVVEVGVGARCAVATRRVGIDG